MLVATVDGVAAGGAFLILAGTLWFWWAMIDEGWLWWIGALFLPLLYVVFLCIHFKRAVKPFGLVMLGTIILLQTDSFPRFGKSSSYVPAYVNKPKR